jgi:MoaA/NifB/PqqE/SkfB family radical SAM enzyme
VERLLFINVTRQCNVQCDRCYLTPENRRAKERLEPDVLSGLIQHPWFREKPLVIAWEGGEASLIGRERFTELVLRCKRDLPHARQSIVTNLLTAPDWLIDLTHEYFNGKIETTLAMDRKYTLDGSREVFLDQFAKNFQKVTAAGLNCPINLETNQETIDLGADKLLDYLEMIGATTLEFDISVDFQKFFQDPAYELSGYPILPLSVDYKQLSAFVIEVVKAVDAGRMGGKIICSLLEQTRHRTASSMFGVQRGFDFITLNPDGTVTTNPLFSDLLPTHLGKIGTDTVDHILFSGKRDRLMRHELRRTMNCLGCEFYEHCGAGPSHVPVFDGSGDCSGLKTLWQYFG